MLLALPLFLGALHLALAADALTPKGLSVYCNVTGPCLPCTPQLRLEATCSISEYRQAAECIAALEDWPPASYDFEQKNLISDMKNAGDQAEGYFPCESPQQWSVLGFEAALLGVLVIALVVIRWREWAIRSLA
jgi:hypothetical protein